MANNLNRAVGGSMPTPDAKKWIKNYQEKNPGKVKAIFYGSDIIQSLISQNGAVGIRIYFAQDDAGSEKLVLVAAKADGNNIVDGEGGYYADAGYPCPPFCGTDE